MASRLTPEQARDLVEWAGGIRPAAREAGIAHSTLVDWLDPEARRERQRAARARDIDRARQREREAKRRRRERDPEGTRAYQRRFYRNLSGLAYNALLLRNRRNKALQRRAEREQRRAA